MELLPKLYIEIAAECPTGDALPEPEKPEQPEQPEFNSQETHKLEWIGEHNRAFTWLPHNGKYYGGLIKILFTNGCDGLTVPDSAVGTGMQGDKSVYWSGFNQRDHRAPKGNPHYNDASIFGPAGCRATNVTIFFNRK